MKKYAKIVNEETNQVSVGTGTNTKFYKSIGMTEMHVEQGWDGNWYLAGYVPEKPAPTQDEQRRARAQAYAQEVDPMMAEYTRKKTFELISAEEAEEMLQKIRIVVAEIKNKFPYPENDDEEMLDNQEIIDNQE